MENGHDSPHLGPPSQEDVRAPVEKMENDDDYSPNIDWLKMTDQDTDMIMSPTRNVPPTMEDVILPIIKVPPAKKDIDISPPTMDMTHDRKYVLNPVKAEKVENGLRRIDDMLQVPYDSSPNEQVQNRQPCDSGIMTQAILLNFTPTTLVNCMSNTLMTTPAVISLWKTWTRMEMMLNTTKTACSRVPIYVQD